MFWNIELNWMFRSDSVIDIFNLFILFILQYQPLFLQLATPTDFIKGKEHIELKTSN